MTSREPTPTPATPGAESRLEASQAVVFDDDRPDDFQRARAQELMRQRNDDLADRAEGLALELTTLAEAMRWGHLPDHDPVEIAAREFDEAVGELRDLRRELAEAELLPDDHPEPPAPEPSQGAAD